MISAFSVYSLVGGGQIPTPTKIAHKAKVINVSTQWNGYIVTIRGIQIRDRSLQEEVTKEIFV